MKVWILILMDEPEGTKDVIGVYATLARAEGVRDRGQDDLLGGQYYSIMETEVSGA